MWGQGVGGTDKSTHPEPVGDVGPADITRPWRTPDSYSKRGKTSVMLSVRGTNLSTNSLIRAGLGPASPPAFPFNKI